MKLPEFNNIQDAHNRIRNQIKHTPVLTSESVNKILGCEIYFKCENFQKVGAFKFRGASNAVLSLTDDEAQKGVATHSSGNHAQALALAARMRGVPAYIVMPNNSPKVKSDAVAGYGGKIIYCEPNLKAREDTLEKVTAETGAKFIHPYNNFNVICGQGTAAIELLDEVVDLDIVMTPVGGGGLLSGTSISVKHISPKTEVIAGEPKGADDAYQSIMKGDIVPSVNPKTIADGLLTSLGTLTFEIIKKNVSTILTVEEETIIKSMRLIWERMKIIIEPSCAVPVAAIMENPERFKRKKVGIILSGGNVDLGKLPF
ncbi:MAG: pyridoxal-phosphate dependent enzyme [Candidatus Kapabacteria bacterium]|nr:pyridoxal-phosphate dependent enzyme [Ignavibacteriota bacterium]MCW5885059.1 pyridoxal-phosphate dependent enzyme [Candidatus Kapabacteria bacterium]